MNEKHTSDLLTLYKEMKKYNFNKEYKVSVSIVENDEEELSELHADNGEKSSEPMKTNGRYPITSIYFQNTQNNQKLNTEKRNVNNALILPQRNINEDAQKDCQINAVTRLTESIIPQTPNLNLHPTVMHGDLSSSYCEANPLMYKNSNELDMLSKNIISILKAYNHFYTNFMNHRNNKILQKNFYDSYVCIKERYFRACCDIMVTAILPQGKHFNVTDFLYNTTHIAIRQEKLNYTYKSIETIYNEIASSCYKNLSSNEDTPIYHVSTKDLQNDGHCNIITQTSNGGPNSILQSNSASYLHSSNITQSISIGSNTRLQDHLQNSGHYNDITQTINTRPELMSQQNSQNYLHSNNITQTMSNEPNSNLQKHLQNNGYCNNITQTINTRPKLMPQQNSQNYLHSNNITQTISNEPNSNLQEHLQNSGHYNDITQTINTRPESILQQYSKNNRYPSNITQTMSNGPNSTLEELLQNDGFYNNIKQTNNKQSNPILQPNYNNEGQPNNVLRIINKDQNYINGQQNSSNQRLSTVPTKCIFQYVCPNYEVRVDGKSKILRNVNRKNDFKNYFHMYDPSDTKRQCTTNDVRKSVQSTGSLNGSASRMSPQFASQNLQEPTRSISRDSGFMSPCNNQINDLCSNGEGQGSTSPFITHVTSLNPGVTHIPLGSCYICGKMTKQKCLGCYKYYYCSNECQNQDWSRHLFDCTKR